MLSPLFDHKKELFIGAGCVKRIAKYDKAMDHVRKTYPTVDDVMGVGEDPVGEDGMDIDAPAWPPAGVEPAMRA
eukprot:jgi/Tetstr1/436250/TSEL_025093.t1